MKNIIQLKKISPWAGIFLVLLWAVACDNSDPESREVNYKKGISETQPKLYQKYLQNLRDYKASPHKIMIVSFDNSEKESASVAHSIDGIPDSVDYVSLIDPDKLITSEFEQMNVIRKNKGTKFIFTIHYDSIDAKYRQMQEKREEAIQSLKEGEAQPKELPSFEKYVTDTLQYSLSLMGKFKYDGICIGYNGKSMSHLSDAEIKEYEGYHNTFIGILKDWYSRNGDTELFFEGKPQNLLDKSDTSFIEKFKYIIIPPVRSIYQLDLSISMANVEGVPNDRYVGSVKKSQDLSDPKTDEWDDVPAIWRLAQYAVSEHKDYQMAGAAFYRVESDYYLGKNPRTYNKTRTAISIMNPPIKK